MRKVLIVDDEKYIRAGLKSMIQRANTQFNKFVECKNGREALAYIMRDKFDLVITDIRMPQMDGLELMREIQQINYSVPIVILSGYDDFQYAVEAIKYGARAYILKPVDRMELYNVLKKVELELIEREDMEKKNRYIDKFRQNQLHYVFLNDYLSSAEINEILENLEIYVFHAPFYVAILDSKPDGQKNNFYIDLGAIEDYIKQNTHNGAVCFQEATGELVLAVNQNFVWEDMLKYLERKYDQNFVLAVSGLAKSPIDIRKAYIEAREALKYRIFLKKCGALYFDDIEKRQDNFVLPYEKIERAFNMIGVESKTKLEKELYEILSVPLFYKNKINYLEGIVQLLKQKISKSLMLINSQKREELQKKYLCVWNPYYFEYIKEYCDCIIRYIAELNDCVWNFRTSCGNIDYKIDMAIQYIKEHYHEDLNLAVVANYVSLNYYYFSHVFKEQTGMSFMNFLNKVRIEKAQEFLKNTDDKVSDIAVRVGFENPKHFTKSFKKIAGISPTQYRQRFYSN